MRSSATRPRPSPYLGGAKDALYDINQGRKPLALMDSGVGGLPYLEAARGLLPGESFVYLADRAGFPYGTKSRAEIEAIVLDRVDRLIRAFAPKALVIACNTASQAALAAVRQAHPELPIVGTVPAVKPAAERTRSKVIGVMATAQAVIDPYLDELIASFAAGTEVLREPAQDLVSFVERDFIASTEAQRREAVFEHARRLVVAGADEIVLSCTHFLHVSADIEAAANEVARGLAGRPRIEVVDSRDGVARRLKDVLAALGPAEAGQGDLGRARVGEKSQGGVFLLSGPPPFAAVYSSFASLYRLSGPYSLDEE